MAPWRARWAAPALVSLSTLLACAGGGDDDATLGSTAEATTPTAPGAPAPSAPGTGVVVVGRSSSSFAVTACQLEPDPAAPEGARALVMVAGAGTTGSGVAFTVEVQRFATGTEVVTYTDTITYADTGRILQAQRIEVGGQVTDLRDPKATSALLRTRAGGVSASGLAGAPGGGPDDEGIIGLSLDASC